MIRGDGGLDFRVSTVRTTHAGGKQEGSLLGTTGRMVISPSPGYLATGLRGSYESHDGRTSIE